MNGIVYMKHGVAAVVLAVKVLCLLDVLTPLVLPNDFLSLVIGLVLIYFD